MGLGSGHKLAGSGQFGQGSHINQQHQQRLHLKEIEAPGFGLRLNGQ